MDFISVIIIILYIIVALLVIRYLWKKGVLPGSIVGGAISSTDAEDLLQKTRDYLRNESLSSQDLKDLEENYQQINLDEKRLVPSKIKSMISRPGNKNFYMVHNKIVASTLLHLHILTQLPNDISVEILKKNKTILKMLSDRLKKEDPDDQRDLEALQDLVTKRLSQIKGEPMRKISDTSSSDMALKMLLLELGYPACLGKIGKHSAHDDIILRTCQEDNALLRTRIRQLQEDTTSGIRRDELLRRLEDLRREKMQLESRLADCRSGSNSCAEHVARADKLRQDLSNCEENLRNVLNTVAPAGLEAR